MPPNCTLEQLAAVQAANSSDAYSTSQIIWIWSCLFALGFNIVTVLELHRSTVSSSIKKLFLCRLVFMTFFTISFVASQFYSMIILSKQSECGRLTPASTCVVFRFFLLWALLFVGYFFNFLVTHPEAVEDRSPEEIEANKKINSIVITFWQIIGIDFFTFLFSIVCIANTNISLMSPVDFMRFYPIPLNMFFTSLLIFVNLHYYGIIKGSVCASGETEKSTKESKESA